MTSFFAENQASKLRLEVDAILQAPTDGRLDPTETQIIDFKEEPGRRGKDGLEPGRETNDVAAQYLANEVACFANSPGGGAIIVGVEDETGHVIGTALDTDWLRLRIYQLIDVAPAVEEYLDVCGQRVVVVYIPESPEPITDLKGRIRWRVGDTCAPVDRAAWWEHRSVAVGADTFATATSSTSGTVTSGALRLARQAMDLDETVDAVDVLRRVGALRSDNTLTRAGELVFCPVNHPALSLCVIDVHGGEVTSFIEATPGQSLLEQIDMAEKAISTVNSSHRDESSFASPAHRQIPVRATREVILNGLIHRDWTTRQPTEIQWVTADSTMIVRSPGGFCGQVDTHNVLSNRHARHPALADLFRALRYVEKQGLGVDRMYQSMIAQGHRPPIFDVTAGPSVECTLVGGLPIVPIVHLMSSLLPHHRCKDVRVAIALGILWRCPFLTITALAEALQVDEDRGRIALTACRQTTFDGSPIIEPLGNAWVLSKPVLAVVQEAARQFPEEDFLPYISRSGAELWTVAERWLQEFGSLSSGELMRLSNASRTTSQRALDAFVGEGRLVKRGAGRSTRFELVSG